MQKTVSTLREFGLSPSPQRVAIYDFLRKSPIHPTVDTIYNAVIEGQPGMSRTTVYNTVKRLVAVGAVPEVIIEDGELRYDADMRDHGHFKCVKCGKVYDMFPPGKIPLVEKIHGLPDKFTVLRLHLCCRGYCSECK